MFIVRIETDNDAFNGSKAKRKEIARILRYLAVKVAGDGSSDRFQACKLFDLNGNTVGSAILDGKESSDEV